MGRPLTSLGVEPLSASPSRATAVRADIAEKGVVPEICIAPDPFVALNVLEAAERVDLVISPGSVERGGP